MTKRKVNTDTGPTCPPEPSLREKLSQKLASMKDHSSSIVEKWRQKFSVDPASAFEWSDAAFSAAASLAVVSIIEAWIAGAEMKPGLAASTNPGEEVANRVLEEIDTTIRTMARNPARSTSAPSNLMEMYKLQAFAAVLTSVRHNGY